MSNYVVSFFKALNSNYDPGDIAHAVSCGLLLAFLPRNNLMWPLLFFILCFIRMNKGTFFISLIIFSFIVPRFDAVSDSLGYRVLTLSFMQGTYEMLYQIPFVGWTKFNNSMVAGSFLMGLICYIPVYVLTRIIIRFYSEKIGPKIGGAKIAKVLGKIPLLNKITKIVADKK